MKYPRWLGNKFSEADIKEIQNAVVQAELKTSAELVPMIVSDSITTGHVPVILFLLQSILFTVIAYLATPVDSPIPHWVFEILAVALALGSAWAQRNVRFWWRVLTPAADRYASVMRRAQLEFFESDIKSTADSTGVLIFVSVLERQAVVLADKGIADGLPAETWSTVVGGLVENMKKHMFRTGFVEAIKQVGTLLEKNHPIASGDVNELSNHLVIKD